MNTNTFSKDSVLMSTILVAALTAVAIFAATPQIDATNASAPVVATAHAHGYAA